MSRKRLIFPFNKFNIIKMRWFIITLLLLLLFYYLPFSFKNNIKDVHLSDSLFELANEYIKKGDFNNGIKHLRNLIKIQNEYALNHFFLGYIYYLNNNFDSALVYFKKTIEIDQEFYDVYLLIGKIFFLKGEYLNAISYLEDGIGLNPYFLECYKELGKNLLMIGDLERYNKIKKRIEQLEGKNKR